MHTLNSRARLAQGFCSKRRNRYSSSQTSRYKKVSLHAIGPCVIKEEYMQDIKLAASSRKPLIFGNSIRAQQMHSTYDSTANSPFSRMAALYIRCRLCESKNSGTSTRL